MNLAQDDPEYAQRKEKLEQSITKCRDTISVIEVKLQKVLSRVTKKSDKKRP